MFATRRATTCNCRLRPDSLDLDSDGVLFRLAAFLSIGPRDARVRVVDTKPIGHAVLDVLEAGLKVPAVELAWSDAGERDSARQHVVWREWARAAQDEPRRHPLALCSPRLGRPVLALIFERHEAHWDGDVSNDVVFHLPAFRSAALRQPAYQWRTERMSQPMALATR